MKLIVCLDERMGMAFNQRRQSRDRVLTEDLVRSVKGSRLFVMPYSVPLFAGQDVELAVSERPMLEATDRDWCFLELCSPETVDGIKELIVYRWNRHYPSDRKFPTALLSSRWQLTCKREFPGKSHETITLEVYDL